MPFVCLETSYGVLLCLGLAPLDPGLICPRHTDGLAPILSAGIYPQQYLVPPYSSSLCKCDSGHSGYPKLAAPPHGKGAPPKASAATAFTDAGSTTVAVIGE
jgi:hypothetical protein